MVLVYLHYINIFILLVRESTLDVRRRQIPTSKLFPRVGGVKINYFINVTAFISNKITVLNCSAKAVSLCMAASKQLFGSAYFPSKQLLLFVFGMTYCHSIENIKMFPVRAADK